MEHKSFDNSGNSIKGVHLKHIPKFLKTFPGTLPIPFIFRLEISKLLVERKVPKISKFAEK